MGEIMLTQNFLKSRTSTRDFKEDNLSSKVVEELNKEMEASAEKYGKEDIKFLLLTDGDDVYQKLQGLAGYKGVMIKAPNYIALNTLNDKKETYVKAAYAMEELITKLNELDLGNCWITVSEVEEDVKKSAFNFTEGDVSILLAIGYPLDETVREHKYYDRLANSDLVYIDSFDNPASDEDLEQRGLNSIFDYAKYAPSAYNSQPWRFLIEDDKLSIYIKDYAGNVNLIDAGIIMYYIDELGKTISSNSKWDIKPLVDGSEYTYIASKNL